MSNFKRRQGRRLEETRKGKEACCGGYLGDGKMRKIAKILIVFVSLSVLLATIIVVNNIRYVAVNESDLIYHPKKIEDSKNAFTSLLPILKQIKKEKPYEQINKIIEIF